MREVLLLASPPSAGAANDNHRVLTEAFTELGCEVTNAPHAALARINDAICVQLPTPTPLADFDLVWLIGFGPMESYARRRTLLRAAPLANFVTPPEAMHAYHSKTAWLPWAPLTICSAESEELIAAAVQHGGDWVLKPEAGSYGRDVLRITAGDHDRIAGHLAGRPGSVWLLQRFLPEIEAGEVRTLVAGGAVVGSYRRLPADRFKANLAQGASPEALRPQATPPAAVAPAIDLVLARGIGFAAVDTVGDYVLEVNVANPGGLSTLAAAVLRWKGLPL